MRVKKKDVDKLKTMGMPAYVVGIDIETEKGYITAITAGIKNGISSISTKHQLDCTTILKLWREVEDYYQHKPGALKQSFC